jgi:hypothetical protein
VEFYGLLPAFEGLFQRPSSSWLVTDNLDCGYRAGNSKNVVFPARSVFIFMNLSTGCVFNFLIISKFLQSKLP